MLLMPLETCHLSKSVFVSPLWKEDPGWWGLAAFVWFSVSGSHGISEMLKVLANYIPMHVGDNIQSNQNLFMGNLYIHKYILVHELYKPLHQTHSHLGLLLDDTIFFNAHAKFCTLNNIQTWLVQKSPTKGIAAVQCVMDKLDLCILLWIKWT